MEIPGVVRPGIRVKKREAYAGRLGCYRVRRPEHP